MPIQTSHTQYNCVRFLFQSNEIASVQGQYCGISLKLVGLTFTNPHYLLHLLVRRHLTFRAMLLHNDIHNHLLAIQNHHGFQICIKTHVIIVTCQQYLTARSPKYVITHSLCTNSHHDIGILLASVHFPILSVIL